MEKKSIWGAIFLNSALAVALAIYTIVAMVASTGKTTKPSTTEVALALRVNDELVVEDGKIKFDGLENEVELVGEKYVAKNAGDFTCTVEKKDKSTVVYAVKVYGYGEGTPADPYNIVKADHLFDLSADAEEGDTIYDNLGATYALRADVDLAGRNWVPVGARLGGYADQIVEEGEEGSKTYSYNNSVGRYDKMFSGTIEGNGFAIKNMTISVTRDNFAEYAIPAYLVESAGAEVVVDEYYLELGFLGYARFATVNGVSFDNAQISVAADIFDGTFDVLNGVQLNTETGVLAGNLTSCNIGAAEKGLVISNSKISSGNTHGSNGIGLLAGDVRYSSISNVAVKASAVEAVNSTTVAGGLIGRVYHLTSGVGTFTYTDLDVAGGEYETTISDIVLENVSVVGNANSPSRTAGVVGVLQGATLKNVQATGMQVSISGSTVSGNTSAVAGAVALVQSFETEDGTAYNAVIENVSVSGNINATDSNKMLHTAAGLVYSNGNGEIVDSTFAGEIVANRAAGLVAYNYGTVKYTTDAKAVDAKLNVVVGGAGLVYENHGDLIGSDNKTAVVVEIVGKEKTTIEGLRNAAGFDSSVDATVVTDSFMMAGVAAHSFGNVSNFAVAAKFTNPVNVGGVVGELGGSKTVATYMFTKVGSTYQWAQTTTVAGGVLENASADVVIETVVGTHPGSTKRAAGVVALAGSGAEIKNVSSIGNANDFATDQQVSGYMVAGIVAEMNGAGIVLDTATTTMNLKANSSAYVIGANEYVSYVAGAIAFINQTEGTAISVRGVEVLSGSIVNNLGMLRNNSGVIDTAVTGAYGLIAVAQGLVGTEVQISDMKISGTEIVSYKNASGAFGIVKQVAIENVVAEVSKVSGREVVAGMIASAQNATISKAGVNVSYLELVDNGTEASQHIAGFVTDVNGTFAATDCYAIVGNDLFVESSNTTIVIAGFAVQDGTASAAGTYTNIVCYVNARKGDVRVEPIISVNGSSTITCSGVKVLADATSEANGIKLLTVEQMKDFANFAEFDADVWQIVEGANCPTFKAE